MSQISDHPPNPLEDYRLSHSGLGYGRIYSTTYERGYYFEQWTRIERPLVDSVLAREKSRGASRLLDFACGTGRILEVAEGHFPCTTGVDVSEEMLGIARTACPRSDLLCRDITSDPLPGDFDVITAFRFFLNAESQLALDVLRSLHVALSDEGRLFLNIHVNTRSPLGFAYATRNALRRRIVANHMSLRSCEEMLAATGFKVESAKFYSLLPRTGWRMEWLARRWMEPVERLAQSSAPLSRLSQCYLVECRKA